MTATRCDFDMSFLDRVSSRIINEVDGITRVLYDGKYGYLDIGDFVANSAPVTSKPPSVLA